LSFQVSCSYGPGRYDANYEEKGQDYPVGFVRWTEQRNFEAVLDMLADGRIDVNPLISHRYKIEEAEQAYELIGGSAPSLGILLRYPSAEEKPEAELRNRTVRLGSARPASGKATLAFIGAGNYATAVLIPAFKATGARLKAVASAGGVSAAYAGRKFGFEETTTATDAIFADPDINALVVATRHNSHAQRVCQGLEAGKAVFVEKPLALTLAELAQIEAAYAHATAASREPLLMVGFNRRFAPQVVKMKSLLAGLDEPKVMLMTVNAGAIPTGHWTQDREVGGGRIIGEACHFIDLLRHLVGSPIVDAQVVSLGHVQGMAGLGDTGTMVLNFADGSIGTVHYLANGHKSFPKERLEVFCGGRILQLDNFRKLTGFGWPGFAKMNLWRQDKGQKDCAAAFVHSVETGGTAPIAFDELVEVSRVTIEWACSVFNIK